MYLYLTYVHPYILAHELDIENLISSSHDQLKRTGIIYLCRLWAYLQTSLGIDATTQTHTPPRPPTPQHSYAQSLLAKFSLSPIGLFDPQSALSAILSSFTGPQTTDMTSSFTLPNLPREEKLSYIKAQKRKLVEYIKFLDDAAAQSQKVTSIVTADSQHLSGASTHEEGYEAVDREEVQMATGVDKGSVVQRGWFGWGVRSVSAPLPTQQQ
jgi:hypothetical protein